MFMRDWKVFLSAFVLCIVVSWTQAKDIVQLWVKTVSEWHKEIAEVMLEQSWEKIKICTDSAKNREQLSWECQRGVLVADNSNKSMVNVLNNNKEKIIYGSYNNSNEIRQKDINELIKKWYSLKNIKLVWMLYKILNDNEEYPDKATFIEMVKIQNETWITIEYLDWLWISPETLKKIKKNASLVEWLWIKWKTNSEKLQAATAANQAEWKWEDIKAANQAVSNIALWH